jgi:dipeptidyl aminopeptidase/acylaminoacyl peptidase
LLDDVLSLRCLFRAIPFCVAVVGFAQSVMPAKTRPVQVADAIRMTQLADPEYAGGGSSLGRVAQFSRDGKRFVVVIKRGDLDRNQNVYSLLLYETANVSTKPEPQVLLTMRSSSNDEGIRSVKWLNDNKTISFIGENPGQISQIYSFNTRTRRLRKLTEHPTPIRSYDIMPNGKRLIYIASPSSLENRTGEWGYQEAKVITTADLFDVLTEKPALRSRWSSYEIYCKDPGRLAVKIPIDQFVTDFEPPSLSPDGRYALLLARQRDVPEVWGQYQDRMIHEFAVRNKNSRSVSQIMEYFLSDLTTGKTTSLLGAPIAWESYASVWAPDSQSVVVSGTYLPLDVDNTVERQAREKAAYIAEVKVPSKTVITITDKPLRVLSWAGNTNRILVGSHNWRNTSLAVEAYERTGKEWNRVAIAHDDRQPVEVSLTEDMNTPPRIFVSDPQTGKRSLLLDLNPQFAELQFGRETAIHWKATNGYEIQGGLYFPVDYTPGRRYPLIIQTHAFRADRFWIDGPWSSAFAAQPLAGRGFVVLQIGDAKNPEDYDDYLLNYKRTPNEAPFEMASYEGAIDNLDKMGLIDRSRVGIIGFSRTVYHVKYALTHSKYRFTAATLADGIDGGYFEYESLPEIKDTDEALNGGVPFGRSLELWLQNAPGFNLDRVDCPVRVEAYGLPSVLEGWEWFVGLSRLQKAVDFILLSHGTHTLVRPWDRMISQQGNVDWFSFWLQGKEDSEVSKRNQYDRWHRLRDSKMSR